VPLQLNTTPISSHAHISNPLVTAGGGSSSGGGGAGGAVGMLRGSQALMCDDAVLDGDAVMVLGLLRLVYIAYRPPA